MSEFYWPTEKGIHRVYFASEQGVFSLPWQWDGEAWHDPGCLAVRRTTDEMIANRYLGVRREAEKPDNAATAQQALDEWRACRKSYEYERWSLKWGNPLCEIAGAR